MCKLALLTVLLFGLAGCAASPKQPEPVEEAAREPTITMITACGGQVILGIVDDGDQSVIGPPEHFLDGGPGAAILKQVADELGEDGKALILDITERLNRWMGMPCASGT